MRLPRVEDIEKRIPRPEDFTARSRGPATTARVGTALGIAFGVCFLTGLWSHFQYTSPGWLPIGPNPAWLYRVTQGTHVATGIASVPLLLVKLWSVYPRFFIRPPKARRDLLIDVLERASIGVLVAAAIFQLTSGLLNIVQWYPWGFSFRRTHEAVAWVAIGALLVHIAVKLPVIREGLGASVKDESAVDSEGPSRRAVLRGATVASGLALVLTVGQTVPILRRISVFGVRDGDGPQDLPVNRTARAAGATQAASDPGFVLQLKAGGRSVSLTRDELREAAATHAPAADRVRRGMEPQRCVDRGRGQGPPRTRGGIDPGRRSPCGRCRPAAPFAPRSCRATSWTTPARCSLSSSTASH